MPAIGAVAADNVHSQHHRRRPQRNHTHENRGVRRHKGPRRGRNGVPARPSQDIGDLPATNAGSMYHDGNRHGNLGPQETSGVANDYAYSTGNRHAQNHGSQPHAQSGSNSQGQSQRQQQNVNGNMNGGGRRPHTAGEFRNPLARRHQSRGRHYSQPHHGGGEGGDTGGNSANGERQHRERDPPKVLKRELYKTEMCKSYQEFGTCRYAEKCQFAHGYEQLRPTPRHPKYKSRRCRNFSTKGYCDYGTRCMFLHEMAPTGPGLAPTSVTCSNANGSGGDVAAAPKIDDNASVNKKGNAPKPGASSSVTQTSLAQEGISMEGILKEDKNAETNKHTSVADRIAATNADDATVNNGSASATGSHNHSHSFDSISVIPLQQLHTSAQHLSQHSLLHDSVGEGGDVATGVDNLPRNSSNNHLPHHLQANPQMHQQHRNHSSSGSASTSTSLVNVDGSNINQGGYTPHLPLQTPFRLDHAGQGNLASIQVPPVNWRTDSSVFTSQIETQPRSQLPWWGVSGNGVHTSAMQQQQHHSLLQGSTQGMYLHMPIDGHQTKQSSEQQRRRLQPQAPLSFQRTPLDANAQEFTIRNSRLQRSRTDPIAIPTSSSSGSINQQSQPTQHGSLLPPHDQQRHMISRIPVEQNGAEEPLHLPLDHERLLPDNANGNGNDIGNNNGSTSKNSALHGTEPLLPQQTSGVEASSSSNHHIRSTRSNSTSSDHHIRSTRSNSTSSDHHIRSTRSNSTSSDHHIRSTRSNSTSSDGQLKQVPRPREASPPSPLWRPRRVSSFDLHLPDSTQSVIKDILSTSPPSPLHGRGGNGSNVWGTEDPHDQPLLDDAAMFDALQRRQESRSVGRGR